MASVSAGEVHIIDSDHDVGELLMELLENQFQVKTFEKLDDFKKSFIDPSAGLKPDLIISDAKLQDARGLETLKFVRKHNRTVPFILLVNKPSSAWVNEAFKAGVTDLLEKPFESFLFIDKFPGRIQQSRALQNLNKAMELLESQALLTTTHYNRLVDRANLKGVTKLRYPSKDEDKIKFDHARKTEAKLLIELEQHRNDFLKLEL